MGLLATRATHDRHRWLCLKMLSIPPRKKGNCGYLIFRQTRRSLGQWVGVQGVDLYSSHHAAKGTSSVAGTVKKYFASRDPHLGLQFIPSDILSGMSSGILSGILFDILSGILSGISSGILSVSICHIF